MGLFSLPSILAVGYRPWQRVSIKVNLRSNSFDSVARLLDPAARRRVHSALACLLLLTISYGAIVEAAHSHGFFLSHRAQLTSVSDGSDAQSSYQGHASHNDCSLCQFQRQLFGRFVHVVLIAHTPQQVVFLSEETVSYLSTSTLPTSGRSPPLS